MTAYMHIALHNAHLHNAYDTMVLRCGLFENTIEKKTVYIPNVVKTKMTKEF